MSLGRNLLRYCHVVSKEMVLLWIRHVQVQREQGTAQRLVCTPETEAVETNRLLLSQITGGAQDNDYGVVLELEGAEHKAHVSEGVGRRGLTGGVG